MLFRSNTAVLKKLCHSVLKRFGASKYHTIYIGHDRTKRVHGRAQVAGNWIQMWTPSDRFDVGAFARVLTHEVGHNYGKLHEDMVACHKIDVSYCGSLIVNKKAPKVAPVIDRKAVRLEHSKAKVREFETKLRRCQTLLKKWRFRVAYYEKQLSQSINTKTTIT